MFTLAINAKKGIGHFIMILLDCKHSKSQYGITIGYLLLWATFKITLQDQLICRVSIIPSKNNSGGILILRNSVI